MPCQRRPKVAPCCGCTCVAHMCVCISYCSVDFEMKLSKHIRNERLGSRLALFDSLACCLHSLTSDCLLQSLTNILGLRFENFNLATAMESRACRAMRHDIIYLVVWCGSAMPSWSERILGWLPVLKEQNVSSALSDVRNNSNTL